MASAYTEALGRIYCLIHDKVLTVEHLGVYVTLRYLDANGQTITYQRLKSRLDCLSIQTLKKLSQNLVDQGLITIEVIQGEGIKVVFVVLQNSSLPPVPHYSSRTISNTSSNQEEEIYKSIIDDLNSVSGRNFKLHATDTVKKIKWLLSHDYKLEDFKKVHRVKKAWLTDPKMSIYYRPATLYAQEHFDSYLNEAPVVDSGKATRSKWDAPEKKSASEERRKKLEERYGKGESKL